LKEYLFLIQENKLYQIYIENEILQKVYHPNILKCEGIFEENDKIFMVIEYLQNKDFYEFLKINSNFKKFIQ
jgi:3-phosphoinositide dependent protein kinase-1